MNLTCGEWSFSWDADEEEIIVQRNGGDAFGRFVQIDDVIYSDYRHRMSEIAGRPMLEFLASALKKAEPESG